ncbi:hypothetical protein VIAG107301_04080 [Vibrio agarivorans]
MRYIKKSATAENLKAIIQHYRTDYIAGSAVAVII